MGKVFKYDRKFRNYIWMVDVVGDVNINNSSKEKFIIKKGRKIG